MIALHHRLLAALLGLALCLPVAASEDTPLFVVHFSVGPQWNAAIAPAEQAGFSEHSANLRRLRDEGRIRFGARYGDYGMVFLAAPDLVAAEAEIAADPGVTTGLFVATVQPMRVFYPWAGTTPETR